MRFLFYWYYGSHGGVAVREGRRREFAKFPEFRDPAARERIPDPTAPATFEASVLDWAARERPPHDLWLSRYRRLLALRRAEIVPRLKGAAGHSGSWRTIGEKAIEASWRLGDGSRLVLVANFSERKLALEAPTAGRLLYSSAEPWREGEAAALSASYHLTG
jgi:1,4-alpha-glucan branching enzyme